VPVSIACAICGTPVEEEKYRLCQRHWALVPAPLQRTIWRLWANGRRWDGYEEAWGSAVEQAKGRARARLGDGDG